jgi:hypothetical protein
VRACRLYGADRRARARGGPGPSGQGIAGRRAAGSEVEGAWEGATRVARARDAGRQAAHRGRGAGAGGRVRGRRRAVRGHEHAAEPRVQVARQIGQTDQDAGAGAPGAGDLQVRSPRCAPFTPFAPLSALSSIIATVASTLPVLCRTMQLLHPRPARSTFAPTTRPSATRQRRNREGQGSFGGDVQMGQTHWPVPCAAQTGKLTGDVRGAAGTDGTSLQANCRARVTGGAAAGGASGAGPCSPVQRRGDAALLQGGDGGGGQHARCAEPARPRGGEPGARGAQGGHADHGGGAAAGAGTLACTII